MLEKNRLALKEKGILEIIENCEDDPNIKVEDDKLFYGDIELDEKRKVKENVKPIDTIFLHGFGYGNTLKILREAFPETVIVVLESNPCIIKKTLEHKDLSEIILDKKVIIAIIKNIEIAQKNITTVIKILNQRLNWSDVIQFTSPNYDKVSFYKIKEIRDILKKELSLIIVNRNTLINRSVHMSENILYNIPSLAKGGYIEYFNDRFKNKPAVIVASGPSLSKNVGLLKEIQDKAVIIAADSVISVLKDIDVEPDFVCGVDHQQINENKYSPILKEKKRRKSHFVGADGIYFSIPKLFKHSFFELSGGSIGYLYSDIFEKPKKKHFSLNNVANIAIQLAYIMGANPIIFIGQDWAYSGGQDHAKGVFLSGGLPKNVIWVKGNYEEKIPTTETLYSGLKIVEEIIKSTKNEGFKYVNATEGGAYIEGTEVISFKEAIDKYLKERIDKSFIKKPRIELKHDAFIRKTEKISKSLEDIIKKATKALAIDNKVLKRWIRNKNVEEIRKDVDEVNKINDEITFDNVFSSAVAIFYFKDFFYFYREEMYIEGQDTKKRIEQSIKYFKLIKSKSVLVKKRVDKLLEFLKLEHDFIVDKEKFVKKLDRIIRLAELYFEFKDTYSGLELVDYALSIYPDSADLYYWKAKLHTLNRFMHKEALESFEKAIELRPDFEKAIFDYEVEKKMVMSHMILAKNSVEKKEFPRAKLLLKRALDYEPDNEEIKRWIKIVDEIAKLDQNVQRQNLLFEQLKIEDESFDMYKKAIDFVKKEEFDKAFDILKELYDKHGAFGDIPFLLGSIHVDRKELDEAEKYLKEAVELIPYQPLVYLALGKLYIEKEEYLLAKENLEKAIAMNPNLKPGVLDTLGNLYYEFGEYEKAFKAFEEFLEYSDDKIKTLTKLALCYKEMGMIEEYNKLMEKIRTITEAN
ncbi:6-hydroxymethylpterin diphosphokinase MptE-like protein [Hippea alviniae]|uniref:6-hydroxymethylpterin diphosphokinase MptE-like protein n=1 Tax=Hippea alviniae TaxID=1279027 RepID=UPI0003B5BF7C|nr:6-hydroxymethylpterin diphosphokinase MptE-like protein [Hippea alviniae]